MFLVFNYLCFPYLLFKFQAWQFRNPTVPHYLLHFIPPSLKGWWLWVLKFEKQQKNTLLRQSIDREEALHKTRHIFSKAVLRLPWEELSWEMYRPFWPKSNNVRRETWVPIRKDRRYRKWDRSLDKWNGKK